MDYDASRRSALQALAALIGAAAVDTEWVGLAQAAHEAHAAARASGQAAFTFLTAAEAADVEAITAQIVPTDDTPGAREAGVVYFIDRMLATHWSHLGAEYRGFLAGFQADFRTKNPDVPSLAALPDDRQIAYLRTIDHTPFFEITRQLTLFGLFSKPEYGGNRGGAGWRLIGFEDRHGFQPPFGYYDRDYPGFASDPGKTP